MKVLIVDNYDSFTYNLVDALRSLKVSDIGLIFNDKINWGQIDNFHKILISPGPGTPEESGELLELIRRYHPTKSILGICLGHQAIARVFGGQLINIRHPRHGQTATISISDRDPIFSGLPSTISGGLYHSWVVDQHNLPPELEVIAHSDSGIMGFRHINYDLVGLQFHPESYATPYGVKLLGNWLWNG